MSARKESRARLSARTVSAPSRLSVPERTALPGRAHSGADSPLTTETSRLPAPATTVPSTGIRSPGATRIRSPGSISVRSRNVAASVRADHRRSPRHQAREARDGVPRPPPHRVVQRAPGKQEENQRRHRVEIRVRPSGEGVVEAESQSEQDSHGDRKVHAGGALPHRIPCRNEEHPSGIGNGGHGKQRGNQVEGVSRPGVRARPHRHRQEHDVHGGEAGHRRRPQQPRHLGIAPPSSASARQASYPMPLSASIIGGAWPSPRHLTATRRAVRFTRAATTPSRRCSAPSIAAMQAPQRACGTDRSVWKTPSPRSRLASTISRARISRSGREQQPGLGSRRAAAHRS